ncbi:MAG: TlpA family protein disulfide reductase [Gammaproteobacteria bacterium]|nr:TlpA family protein disulfide reductase [Gammaproteobacteria bacterium]
MRSIIILLILLLTSLAPAVAQDLTLNPDPQTAPDFRTKDVQGKVHRLTDYRGQLMVVNFWATWCPPCVREMPSLQRAWEELHRDGIQVLAINMGQSPEEIKNFLKKYPLKLPLLLDEDVKIAESWGVGGLPTTIMVDGNGRIIAEAIGPREWDEPDILDQIRALAKPKTTAVPASGGTRLSFVPTAARR